MPAARPQGLKAEFDMASRKRIQDNVDTFSPSGRHQSVMPVEAVGIECGAHAQRQKSLALALAAGSRVDFGPYMLGQRDGGLPDTAHCRVDQHSLPLHQTRRVDERIVRGHVDGQRGGGLFHAEAVGFGEDEGLVHCHAIGNAAARDKGHLVAHAAMPHFRSDPTNDSAGLHADVVTQCRAFVGHRRQETERHHDVAEVEGRGRHVDLHIPWPWRRHFVGLHLQTGDLPGIVQDEPIRAIPRGGNWQISLFEADHPRRPQELVAHCQLAFAQIAPRQPRQGFQVAGIPQVDQPEIDLGVVPDFQCHAAGRTPKRAAAGIFHGVGGSLRHHGQSAPMIRLFDSMRSQGLDECDEARGQVFAHGVSGIGAAEKVDGLQVRHVRPLVERLQRGACPISAWDQVCRTRPVEQGHPFRSPARLLTQHPSRARKVLGVGPVDIFVRRLQQRRTPPRSQGFPARARFQRTFFVVKG